MVNSCTSLSCSSRGRRRRSSRSDCSRVWLVNGAPVRGRERAYPARRASSSARPRRIARHWAPPTRGILRRSARIPARKRVRATAYSAATSTAAAVQAASPHPSPSAVNAAPP